MADPTKFFDDYEVSAEKREQGAMDRFILKLVKTHLLKYAGESISVRELEAMWYDHEIEDKYKAFTSLAHVPVLDHLVITRYNIRDFGVWLVKGRLEKSPFIKLYKDMATEPGSAVMFMSGGKPWVIHKRPEKTLAPGGLRILWATENESYVIQTLESYLEEYS